MTDPAKAVKQELGIDPDASVCVFVVPPRPADLTDEQLESAMQGQQVIISLYCC